MSSGLAYFVCRHCQRAFTRLDNLKRHQKTACVENRATASSSGVDKRALSGGSSDSGPAKTPKLCVTAPEVLTFCEICRISVPRRSYVGHLRSKAHNDNACGRRDDGVSIVQSAFQCRLATYRVESTSQDVHVHVEMFLNDIKNKVFTLLKEEIEKHVAIKVNFELYGLYYLATQDLSDIKSHNTKNEIFTHSTILEDIYHDLIVTLDRKAAEFQERESGKFLIFVFCLSTYLYLFPCCRLDVGTISFFRSSYQ